MPNYDPNILVVVAARGGENPVALEDLGGISVLGLKIEAAKASKYTSRIILSSEDDTVHAEAKKHGAEVPFTRPQELALPSPNSNGVLHHAVTHVGDEADNYDAVLYLEANAPFLTAADIDQAVERMFNEDKDFVLSFHAVDTADGFVEIPSTLRGEDAQDTVDKIASLKDLRRASQPKTPEDEALKLEEAGVVEFTPNGVLYMMRMDTLRARDCKIYTEGLKVGGLIMDKEQSLLLAAEGQPGAVEKLEQAREIVAEGKYGTDKLKAAKKAPARHKPPQHIRQAQKRRAKHGL